VSASATQWRRACFGSQQNAAVPTICELRIQLAERLDQIGLAMEIDRILVGGGFHPVDADRAAASGLAGEIADLTPFDGFIQRPDAIGGARGVKNELPQREQLCPQRLWIAAENCRHFGI
jgi:hypothetical protein